MKRLLSILLLSVSLVSCASLLPNTSEPLKKYTLSSVQSKDSGAVYKSKKAILVELPTVYGPLETTRIAIQPQEGMIDYIADIEWAERLAILMQDSLVYSIQNSGEYQSISRPSEGLQSDYLIKVGVRKFNFEKDSSQKIKAVVEYHLQLIKLEDKSTIKTKIVNYEEAVPKEGVNAMMVSLDKAYQKSIHDILSFLRN